MGFENHIIGSLAATADRLARQSQEGDRHGAIASRPTIRWRWRALGGWNIEVVRVGGAFGRWLYDASFDAGVKAFNQAIAAGAQRSHHPL